MKILARVQDGSGRKKGAIVEMSDEELAIITSGYRGSYTDNINAGATLAIDKKFEHSNRVVLKAEEALKLPGVLRSLADTLEFIAPKIEALKDASDPDSWNTTNEAAVK